MKANPSNLKPEVREERRPLLPLAIDSWGEEFFTVPIRPSNVVAANPALDWDDIEAVGAADDASRFRIDEPLADTLGICP